MSGKNFIYFAYCANMLSNRMECCVSKKVKRLGLGKLNNYKMTFGNFNEMWYGTLPTIQKKCDCIVWGTLWEVDECHRPKLDALQGVEKGLYVPVKVPITALNTRGGTFDAWTYKLKKDPPEPELKDGVWMKKYRPSKIYIEEMIDGADESCLPVYYRKWLRRIPHNGYSGSFLPNLKED